MGGLFMEQTIGSRQKIKGIAKGLAAAYLISGAMLLLLALLLYKLHFDNSKITIGVILIYVFSCFIGGFLAGKKIHTQKFLWGLLLGILYFLILAVISGISRSGTHIEPKEMITTLLICVGSGMAGGMLS